MQELLDRHPAVHFIGFEPFDNYRFKQKNADSALLPSLLKHFLAGNEGEFRQLFQSIGLPVNSVDFGKSQALKLRLVTHITKNPASKSTLLSLLHRSNVHQFFVRRKCRLLQQLSAYRGHLQFDLKRGTKTLSELRARIRVNIPKLRKLVSAGNWYQEAHASLFKQTQCLDPQLSSWLYYEDFLYRKREFLQSTLETLELSSEPKLLKAILAHSDSFKKVHSDRVEDIVENCNELRSEFPKLFDEYLRVRDEYEL